MRALLGAVALALGLHGLAFISTPSKGSPDMSATPASLRGHASPGFAAHGGVSSSGTLTACGGVAGLTLIALATQQRRAAVTRAALGVGQKVSWNGKAGTVAYVGPVKFAAGEWVGVALDGPGGMHDGTVMGVQYFSCTPRTGVFATPASLAASGPAPASGMASTTVASSAPTSELECSAAEMQLCVGGKVMWNGKPGTVAYIGSTKFASGEWVGVELDAANGMHDGTVMGVTYFAGKPKHGIFAKPSTLKVA